MDVPHPAALEVTDTLTVAIARDEQRLAVRLSPDQARAVAGALAEYAARAGAGASGEPIRAGSAR